MAKVYCQIDAVRSLNSEHVSVLLHVYRHELVADFGCVLSRVRETELSGLHELLDVLTVVEIYLFALNSLRPSNLVQALPKKYDKRENSLVVEWVCL